MLRALTFLISVLAVLPSAGAASTHGQHGNAISIHGVYGDLHLALGGVQHSDVNFNPGFASLSVGVWLWKGIGIEVFGDKGLNAGNDGDFDLEITDASGFAARFQSPSSDGMFAYVVLGVVNTRIEQAEDDNDVQPLLVQNYRGGRLSIGFGRELQIIPGGRLTAEYRNYFVDDDLQMDALSVGLQLNFR
ncbi:MAG: hypothetical protein KTR32_16740 [Granulosicoccus sp.]|nr:hypothetical protein [Granulosicoccus sp.]